MAKHLRIAVVALLCLVAVFQYWETLGRASFKPKTFQFDLVGFYCGGRAISVSRDPYLVEPLRTCEHEHSRMFRPGVGVVVPAPLPPYEYGALALASRMPFASFRWWWVVAQICACAGSIFLLSRLCGLSIRVVGASLVVADLACSVLLGQVVPFCVFGICLAAWGLEYRSRTGAFGGLLLAMIEPQLGLPVLVCVFVCGGRFRWLGVASLASLAAASLATMPFDWLRLYVEQVLPAHALSEANNQEQFSSLYALHSLGLTPSASLALSKINYVLVMFAGVVCARRCAAHHGAAFLVTLPAAFALLGGPYEHVTQVAAAVPAAMLLAGRTSSRLSRYAAALLSIPWIAAMTVVSVAPIVAAALFVLLRRFWHAGIGRAAFLAFAAVAAEIAAALLSVYGALGAFPVRLHAAPNQLAETVWVEVVDARAHDHVALSTLLKLPTLVGLCALALAAYRVAPAGRNVVESSTARRSAFLPSTDPR